MFTPELGEQPRRKFVLLKSWTYGKAIHIIVHAWKPERFCSKGGEI